MFVRITTYKNSVLATIVSFISTLFGILAALSLVFVITERKDIAVGLMMAAAFAVVAVALAFLAGAIARRAQAKAASNPQAVKTKKPMTGKRKAGIFLVVAGLLAIIFPILNKTGMFYHNGVFIGLQGVMREGPFYLVGYLSPMVIGLILILIGGRKPEQASNTTNSNYNQSYSQSANTSSNTQTSYRSQSQSSAHATANTSAQQSTQYTGSQTSSNPKMAPRFCTNCGSSIHAEANFCAKCGRKVYRPE